MLDSFIARLSVLDAWRDYFDELNQIMDSIIRKIFGYNWVGVAKHLGA